MISAVQQFMLGGVLRNERQARAALERIRNSGYDGIELCSFMTNKTPLIVRLLTRLAGMPCGRCGGLDRAALTREYSLRVVSLHTDLGTLEKDIAATAKEAIGYGTKYVVITGMYRFDYTGASNVKALAERLNKAGEELLGYGLHLLYHNHNAELTVTDEGARAYEILMEATDERFVNYEYDSYWFSESGADPVYWMRKLGKRMKLWHVNDRGTRQRGASITPILKTDAMELGTGNMPLDALFEAALDADCEAAVLEMHRNWINNDPFLSLELSARLIHDKLK